MSKRPFWSLFQGFSSETRAQTFSVLLVVCKEFWDVHWCVCVCVCVCVQGKAKATQTAKRAKTLEHDFLVVHKSLLALL